MPTLDPSSILYTTAALSLVMACVLAAMYRGFPPSIGGLKEWAWGIVVIFASNLLFFFRDAWPDVVTYVAANGLLWSGSALCYIGLCRFCGRRPLIAPLYMGIALAIIAMAWVTLTASSYQAKVGLNALVHCMLLTCSCYAAGTLRPRNFSNRFATYCYGVAAVLFGLRLAAILLGLDTTQGLSDPTPIQKLYLITFALSGLLNTLAFTLMANQRLHDTLRHAAAYDALSGALNRGAVLDQLSHELARVQRYNRPLSVLLIDMDHFKHINDRHGHLVGDLTLAHFAARAMAQLRRSDLLGRYGGEEFLAVLPDTDAAMAAQVAERIRVCVASESREVPDYTVSIGVASATPDMSIQDLLLQADQALYRAKDGGRNRIEMAMSSLAGSVAVAC